jgi:neutral ceramidase
VHDPLYARAVAIDDGEQVGVIVALDLCVVSSELTARVRAGAAERWDLDPTCILLAASHTHSGPDYGNLWEDVDPSVPRYLEEMILSAIGEALFRRRPASIGWGEGELEAIAINRRHPEGPIDSEVTVLRIETVEGEPIAVIFRYTCHTIVVGSHNRLLSPDFAGHAATTVERAIGNGAPALFLNGAAGNINPVAFPYAARQNISTLSLKLAREGRTVTFRSHADARRTGMVLGGEVLRVWAMTETVPAGDIAHWRLDVEVPLKGPADMDEFFRHMPAHPSYENSLRRARSLTSEVMALQIGEVVLLALPGEPFVEIGLALQQPAEGGLRFRTVGYANDYTGYILTPEAYAENRYETVGTPLAIEGSQAIIEAATCLRAEVMAGVLTPAGR